MVENSINKENDAKKNEQVNTSEVNQQQSPQTDQVTGKPSKLVGCLVILDPKQSGMFIDKSNDITLSFFPGAKDRILISETMDLTLINKGIKSGRLSVERDKNDVSTDFGGPVSKSDWHRIPIVEKAFKKTTDDDAPFLTLIGRNNQSKIINDINVIKDYKTLERIKELEIMGRNPSGQSRMAVLNAVIKKMDEIGGVGEAKELPQEKEDVITAN